jgi:hypothetical protein
MDEVGLIDLLMAHEGEKAILQEKINSYMAKVKTLTVENQKLRREIEE